MLIGTGRRNRRSGTPWNFSGQCFCGLQFRYTFDLCFWCILRMERRCFLRHRFTHRCVYLVLIRTGKSRLAGQRRKDRKSEKSFIVVERRRRRTGKTNTPNGLRLVNFLIDIWDNTLSCVAFLLDEHGNCYIGSQSETRHRAEIISNVVRSTSLLDVVHYR